MLQSLHELITYEKPKRHILSSTIGTVWLFQQQFSAIFYYKHDPVSTSPLQLPQSLETPYRFRIFLVIAWRKRCELNEPIAKPNVKNKSNQKLLRTAKLKTAFSIYQKRSYKKALSWAELSVRWLASSNRASSFRSLTYLVF